MIQHRPGQENKKGGAERPRLETPDTLCAYGVTVTRPKAGGAAATVSSVTVAQAFRPAAQENKKGGAERPRLETPDTLCGYGVTVARPRPDPVLPSGSRAIAVTTNVPCA